MTTPRRTQLDELEKPHFAKLKSSAIFKFPADIQKILKVDDVSQLAPLDRQLYDLAYRQVQYEYDQIGAKLKDDSKKKWDELRAELKKFDDLKPAPLPIGYAVSDVGQATRAMRNCLVCKSKLLIISHVVSRLFSFF